MQKQWSKKWVCMGKECMRQEYVAHFGRNVWVLYKPSVCILVKSLHATKLGEKMISHVPALGREWIGDQKAMYAAVWDAYMDFPRTEHSQACVTPAFVDEKRPVIYGRPDNRNPEAPAYPDWMYRK